MSETVPVVSPRWRVVRLRDLAVDVRRATGAAGRRPAVIAVDGHSSSGKTTVAHRLAADLPRAAVLHTDDLAWRDSVLDWDASLRQGVLAPLRSGAAVAYRPPAWRRFGRSGAIEIPAETDVLVLEGVGASRRSLAGEIDLSVWVETPEPIRLARDDARLEAGEMSPGDYLRWMAEEDAHFLRDRPWIRASWWISGIPELGADPEDHLVVADNPFRDAADDADRDPS
jgi:hypothetical protein